MTGPSHSGGSSAGTVSISGLLQLHPQHLEAVLWRSPAAIRLLRSTDYICLLNSILFCGVLIKAFFSSWATYQRAQTIWYLSQSVAQLLFMHFKGDVYQRYRFPITCVNRLLRVVTVLVSAWDATKAEPRNANRLATTPQAGSGVSMLLHCVLMIPLFWLNHTTYVLPFPYVLAAQLVTLGGVLKILRVMLCLLSDLPGTHVQLAQQVCQHMKVAASYLGLSPANPYPRVAEVAAAQCQGLNGVVLLSLYAAVVILVLLPCLLVYLVELNLKMGFIKQRRLVLQHAPPCPEAPLAKAVVVFGAVVGSWVACEGLVLLVSPVQCSSTGIVLRV